MNRDSLAPWRERLKAFVIWWSLVGLVFYSVYPVAHWFASQQTQVYRLFFDAELRIPLVKEWIWAYGSIHLLIFLPPFFLNPVELRRLAQECIAAILIAGGCFVIFAAPVGHTRIPPPDEPYHTLFRSIFDFDGPFNSVPSLHVCYSAINLLAISRRSSTFLRVSWGVWFFLIACSTLLVHQHHALDIVTGLALALLMHYCFWRKSTPGR
jgi:membrane-associated phospholipid phosphatase